MIEMIETAIDKTVTSAVKEIRSSSRIYFLLQSFHSDVGLQDQDSFTQHNKWNKYWSTYKVLFQIRIHLGDYSASLKEFNPISHGIAHIMWDIHRGKHEATNNKSYLSLNSKLKKKKKKTLLVVLFSFNHFLCKWRSLQLFIIKCYRLFYPVAQQGWSIAF